MGRWAQRSRSGGGISALNYMVLATRNTGSQIQLTYTAAVDADSLDPNAFQSSPGGGTGLSINQVTPYIVTVDMDDDVSIDDKVIYSGSTPGIRTPQQLAYAD